MKEDNDIKETALQEALRAACWFAKNGDVTNMHPEDFMQMTDNEIVEWHRKAVA